MGQGRCLGWGSAWLAEVDSSSKEEHCLYVPVRDDRRACRYVSRAVEPEFHHLERECEVPKALPDDDSEPEVVP
eukprot:865803-Pyramimonas_sp.AAC.1